MIGSPSMRRGTSFAAGLVLALVGWSSLARAAPTVVEEQPLRIQYGAHEGCPDALGFFWHVRARTRRVRLAEAGELATLVAIRIEREGTESVGTLEMPGPEAQPFQRQVRASTCEEVVLALSLVLALAYDPDAVQTFPAAVPATPCPPVPAFPVAPASPPCPAPPPKNPTSRAALGVDGLLVTGVASGSPHLGVGAFVELGRSGRWFAPTLSAGFVWVAPADEPIGTTGSVATFSYLGGRVMACPVAWTPTARLELAPCLGADFGRISASTDFPEPFTEGRAQFWGKGFLLARIRWIFSDRFFGETFGGGGVTFYDDRFAVERSGSQGPEEFVVPRFAADLGIGLGAYFP